LPFDILRHEAHIVVAVDITPSAASEVGTIPEPIECLFLASHIVTHAIVSEKLKASAPDILLRPDVNLFGSLDFLRAADILRAAAPIKEETKRRLGQLLG
jgi:NTE family protein